MTKRALAAVWMPRFSQFDEDDRTDLKNAISRNGGQSVVCKAAGLIPYATWTRFESFRELVNELFNFNIDELRPSVNEGTYIVPTSTQLARVGSIRLPNIIRTFGGSNAVKELLLVHGEHDLSSLTVLVELTDFIHEDMMSSQPPFSHKIYLPSRAQLIQKNQHDLAAALYDQGLVSQVVHIVPGVNLR